MSDSKSAVDPAHERLRRLENSFVRRLYCRFILPRVSDPLVRQRFKLLYFGWAYLGLVGISRLSLGERLMLLRRFLRVDWNVLHGHLASEMVHITRALAERPARPGEVLVEAGCWQGGSSAKFSILAALLGYRLRIYDSFQGVEELPPEERAQEWDYAGQYASPESRLHENLAAYGEASLCSSHAGWFSETLAKEPVHEPVRMAYIDCDLAKGTFQALAGVMPSLSEDGVVFTQDYHIAPVRKLLRDPATWRQLGTPEPSLAELGVYLAALRFPGR